jgi:TrbL/VirB6 plasmid conjugal transfer protein
MDTFAYTLFTLVSAGIRYAVNQQMTIAYQNLVDVISSIALVIETLFIMHYGYLIAFQKSTDSVPSPSVRDLLRHAVVVFMILAFIRIDSLAFDTLMALRQMVIGSITGDYDSKAGQQVANSLSAIDGAYGAHNVLQKSVLRIPSYPVSQLMAVEDSPDAQQTSAVLSIIAEASPQIVAGILLLMNEITISVGMALFPLALYATIYKLTNSFFGTWFETMLAATVQMAILVVLSRIVAGLTVPFLAAIVTITRSADFAPVGGGVVIPHLQRSIIEAGFGMLMTMMFAWLPAQAATFSGKLINAGTTKGNLGGVMTKTEYEPDVDASNRNADRFKRSGSSTQESGPTIRIPEPRVSSQSSGERSRNEMRARLDRI